MELHWNHFGSTNWEETDTTWDHLGPWVLESEFGSPEHVPAGRQNGFLDALLQQSQVGGCQEPHLRRRGAPRAPTLSMEKSIRGRGDFPACAGSVANEESPGETRITAERARSDRPSGPVAKT
ncbi:hypothetical protein GUJ93_ZPchr0012g20859 [Zizania palustris]|uniref:Uncharacterized protein n=1 Tax=Zizania palustris TaxID=103762 RepID=A0A8J5WJV6_ZIZPA|nr:hypothetical protein GUJ93_ZPchr0012g20859 [Zizania palustris]